MTRPEPTPRERYLVAERAAWGHYRGCTVCTSALNDPARNAVLCPTGDELTDQATDLWLAQMDT